MLQNYYTLLKLKNELNSLIGMKVIEVFSQEKNSITFNFFDGKNESFLHFNTVPFFSALYVNHNFTRAKSNSSDLCNEILGEYLQDVFVHNCERIIEFKFIKFSAIFHIFGGANSNLFVCKNKKQEIAEQARNDGVLYRHCALDAESTDTVQRSPKVVFALNHSEKFLNENLPKTVVNNLDFFDCKDKTLLEALAKSNLLLGKNYATEFCFLNDLNSNILVKNFSENELNEIYEKAKMFIQKLLENKTVYKLKNPENNEIIFSLIPLKDFEILKEFETVSDGIKSVVVQGFVENRKRELLKDLLPKLKRDFKRISDSIKISEDLDSSLERADKYRNSAELLMSQQNIKQRVGEEIELLDWNGKIEKIKLDAKLTLLENANKYFVKSRKSISEAEMREKRLPILKAKLEKISSAIEQIENANSVKELEKIKNELVKKSTVIMQNEERPIATKFRVFELGEGFILYVGKNATNNDELTMKFAKPNDIWLHARGSSGSHCVVKGDIKDGKLPKPILKMAAEIAAYYSGSKNAKFTPVCYTQKKYVNKPKGANVGAVVLQRESVIMVEPKIPNVEEN